jgi:Jacalin-like lectin domain
LVSGHIAPWGSSWQVRSLKFVTNSNSTYGPYGTQEGVPFELPVVVGRIVGFYARAGSMVEAIGIYVKVRMLLLILQAHPEFFYHFHSGSATAK